MHRHQPLSLALMTLLAIFPSSRSLAWSNHTLLAYPVLEALPEVNSEMVAAESFDTFLFSEREGLASLLEREEAWARANVPEYPPRPGALTFKGDAEGVELRRRFLEAIRVNPGMKLPLFLQLLPGADVASGGSSSTSDSQTSLDATTATPTDGVPATTTVSSRTSISRFDITLLKESQTMAESVYVALQEGEMVRAVEVLASASDEPDYGLDIGVWDNNGTEFGPRYQFGKQSFGNPTLEYSSQAPFHMGLFHEARIVYTLAGFVKRTYPEARLHLYQSLASFAHQTGHPYWGWRFAGWGLHYIQDLTQPYHASLLPGVSVLRMLWINTLDMLGFSKAKNNAVQLVTNRHLALEDYQYELVREQLRAKNLEHPILKALASSSADAAYGVYQESYARQTLTLEANGRAKETDRTLGKCLPERLVSDPTYLFEQTEPDISALAEVKRADPTAAADLQKMLEQLLTSFGAHSRNYVRSIKKT